MDAVPSFRLVGDIDNPTPSYSAKGAPVVPVLDQGSQPPSTSTLQIGLIASQVTGASSSISVQDLLVTAYPCAVYILKRLCLLILTAG